MLVLTLREGDGEAIRIMTSDGPVDIKLVEVRGSKVRLGVEAPSLVKIDRISEATGLSTRSKAPENTPLSSGVAEATLACTGQSSDQERSKEAPDAAGPLCRFGQGSHERAIHPHDIDGRPVLGSIVDAVA